MRSQRFGIQTAWQLHKANKKRTVVIIIANAATNVKKPLWPTKFSVGAARANIKPITSQS